MKYIVVLYSLFSAGLAFSSFSVEPTRDPVREIFYQKNPGYSKFELEAQSLGVFALGCDMGIAVLYCSSPELPPEYKFWAEVAPYAIAGGAVVAGTCLLAGVKSRIRKTVISWYRTCARRENRKSRSP